MASVITDYLGAALNIDRSIADAGDDLSAITMSLSPPSRCAPVVESSDADVGDVAHSDSASYTTTDEFISVTLCQSIVWTSTASGSWLPTWAACPLTFGHTRHGSAPSPPRRPLVIECGMGYLRCMARTRTPARSTVTSLGWCGLSALSCFRNPLPFL
jgi:hypothetical protein